MLKIRLSMGGAKKRPVYKIVIETVDLREMEDLLRKWVFLIHCLQKQKKRE